MRLVETLHVSGRPVGRLLVNTNSQEIAFQAAELPSLLPDYSWDSVDELRAAVTAAYSKPVNDEDPSELTDEPSNPLDEDLINHTNASS